MTAPIDPGNTEALPPRDAKVLVTYWTLDCLLDWVFLHFDDVTESVAHHHDLLREDMQRFITDADLREVVYRGYEDEHPYSADAARRLRAVIGEPS